MGGNAKASSRAVVRTRSEPLAVIVYSVDIVMAVWLFTHIGVLSREVFRQLWMLHPVHTWWWPVKLGAIGVCGFLGMLFRCHCWIRVTAASLHFVLWYCIAGLTSDAYSPAVAIPGAWFMLFLSVWLTAKTFAEQSRGKQSTVIVLIHRMVGNWRAKFARLRHAE